MQIVFHIGAHCTDEGQIQACLVKNRATLAEEGIFVPNPGRFRSILRETISALDGGPASAEIQDLMINSIVREGDPQRIIFSNEAAICNAQRALADDMIYPEIAIRSRNFRNLFADQEVEFCLAIRNPATFLPACFSKINTGEFDAYLAQVNPQNLRWSDTVAELQSENPGVPIKIWCNEDTPFIWPQIISELADHSPDIQMKGLDDYLASVMTGEGMERMTSYLKTHPPVNEPQRQRILSAFLDKFEVDDGAHDDITAPEWTEEFVEELTDKYEEDLYTIERMPGVHFIAP